MRKRPLFTWYIVVVVAVAMVKNRQPWSSRTGNNGKPDKGSKERGEKYKRNRARRKFKQSVGMVCTTLNKAPTAARPDSRGVTNSRNHN